MRSTGFVSSSGAFLLALLLSGDSPVLAEPAVPALPPVYTNIAGQAIAGPATGVTNGYVRFGTKRYRLGIGPESERRRIESDCGAVRKPTAPADEERRDRLYRGLLERQDALERAGATTREEAEAQRERIRRAWARGQTR